MANQGFVGKDGKAPQNLLQGQAGVWRVASELALRGFNPCFPGVDHGCDIITEDGVRIQVKCAHLTRDSKVYPTGAYWFKLSKSPIVTGNRNIKKRLTQIFSAKNDFVVLWGITENKFFIVPAELLDGVQLVTVGPDVYHKNLDVDEIRELHDAGFSEKEIAKHLGVAQVTISRRLHGQFVESKTPKCRQVRECEGRWDLIVDFVEQRTDRALVSSVLQTLEEQEIA